MRMARCGLVGICSIFAAGANAGDAEWTSSGPLGGRVHEIVFDPTNPMKAYATTHGGVFRSNDGGNTWSSASNGIVADTIYPLPLIIDADAPNRLYSFDSWGRIYRTDNGASSWAILPDTLPSDVHPAALADKPGLACTVLLGTASNGVGLGPMLFKSTNCGQSFFQIGAGLPTDEAVLSIAFDPSDGTNNTLLVGLDGVSTTEADAIWRSTDGGATFLPTVSTLYPSSGFRPEVTKIAFGSGNNVWAAAGGYSIFHSTDAGLNWFDTGATGVSTVLPDPVDGTIAWVGGADQVGYLDFDGSLYPYTAVNDGLTGNASYDDGTRPIPAGVNRFAVRPSVPWKLFASTQGSGVFSLVDGATPVWTPVAMHPAGAAIRAVAIHPTIPNVVFAGQATYSTSSPAVFRSLNGGTAWSPSNIELEAADIQAFAIDPTSAATIEATTIYAGGRASGSFGDGFRNNGLYRSDDGGENWITLDGNLPPITNRTIGAIRNLALDPNSCAVPPCGIGSTALQRVYAVGHGGSPSLAINPVETYRVMRSNDRGATWSALDGNPGFPTSNRIGNEILQRVTPTVIVVDPANSQRLYVGTEAEFYDSNTEGGSSIDPARESGLFTSADGGTTWTRVLGLPSKINTVTYPNASLDVADLLIDRSGGRNVLWIALHDLFNTGASTIYRSGNGGISWQQMDSGLNSSLELRDLAIDPQNPNVLYAAAGGNGANPGAIYRGVWSDVDATIQWLSISVGLPAESAFTIAVDPGNPNKLHAGSDTGVHSITRLPDQDGDGIPNNVEDQAPDVPGGIVGPGDGNGDGQMDSAQRNVGSSVIILRGLGGGAITSSIVSGNGPSPTACTQAVDVSAINPDVVGLDIDAASGLYYDHSHAARQFEITDCASAVVDITYHGADFSAPGWSFRYFGPLQSGEQDDGFGWYALPTSTRVGPSTWRVSLTADGLGSYRPEADAIKFLGGPACLDDRVLADGFETTPPAGLCPN